MRALLPSILILASALATQAAPGIEAHIEPAEIGIGESARLTVTLSGATSQARPEIPEVDGLNFHAAGQNSQVSIVNGRTSSRIGFTYHVTAERTGEFEIPAISAKGAQSEALKLRVNATSTAQPNRLSKPGAAPVDANTDGLAFLKVERADNGDRDHLYVGELTPIAIRAYFREGTQVSQVSRPALDGGTFTLHQLSEEPQQRSTVIDGQRFRVLTWFAGLSGVKAGDENLSATLDATVGIPQAPNPRRAQQRRPRSPFGGSLFNDPFFDSAFDSFFQRIEPRQISLSSEAIPLAIKSLPTEGRPASFGGAVGQFKLGHFSIPTELETGNPVELKVTVNGKGNFDRVTPPQILPAGKWKIYSAKNHTEPGDSVGYKASKTFILPAIALEPGDLEVGFSFDYFDPANGSYETATTQTMPVAISGTAISAAEVATESGSEPATPGALAPLRASPRRSVSDPAPLYAQTWFIALQSIPAAALLAAGMIGVIRRRRYDPAAVLQRATQKAVSTHLKELSIARQGQDGKAFFNHARRALQHQLAERWHCNAEAITTEDISQRLPQGCDIARVFAMADAVEFSGVQPDPDSYEEWQSRVNAALADIDAPLSNDTDKKPTWGEVPEAA
ncbi:MAG: BatD family protein [Verrucomicrobiales bacterium]